MAAERVMAALAVTFWPIIPLFWLPLHLLPGLKKKLGLLYYLLILSLWLALAFFILSLKVYAWGGPWPMPAALRFVGWGLFGGGLLLQGLTIFYLRSQIIGRPHFHPRPEDHLVTSGPFRYLRHPTYLAHSLIFFGAFFLSGYPVVALVAFLDLLLNRFLLVPLEEKELRERFGEAYEAYARRTPRFLPRWRP